MPENDSAPGLQSSLETQPVLTAWQVIGWWEYRRLLYNAVLLGIGLAALVGMEWLMGKALPEGEDAVEPIGLFFGVIAFGIMANLCYTFGWLIELSRRKANPVAARIRGQEMFRFGMIFSCLVTSLPFWYACVYWSSHLVRSR